MLKAEIFKANDIRGVVVGDDPEWDLEGARDLGSAFVDLLGLSDREFVLGRDMRVLGDELADSFADGARDAGASVVDIGLSSTDMLWFASGTMHVPGVQFTASHNPAEYNGVKFCLTDAAPVDEEFMTRLAERAAAPRAVSTQRGRLIASDMLGAYADYLNRLVPVPQRRRLTVVVDAGNGMAGHTVRQVFRDLNVDLHGLYLDLDGSFPNHPANPLAPENLVDAQQAVVDEGADLGLVFDGDADRCFIIDGSGGVVDPSIVTALIAEAELRREPGGCIVINSITSATVVKVVEQAGGRIATSKVGHTYVKALMAEHDAVFGGEHSAHYYFRDFWGADTGMLAALHVMAMIASGDRTLADLIAQYDVYRRSGELNSTVSDPDSVMAAVAEAFADCGDIDHTDGLTVRRYAGSELQWWLNVRSSNTEPLLRLNVEATDEATLARVRDDALSVIEENA